MIVLLCVVGLFCGQVVQLEQPTQVSEEPYALTDFAAVRPFGNIGILAHSDLLGAYFLRIPVGREIVTYMADGSQKRYKVVDIQRYDAIDYLNIRSDFIDLATGKRLTVDETFNHVFGGDRRLVLQTCEGAWGRLFVIARPMPSVRRRYD